MSLYCCYNTSHHTNSIAGPLLERAQRTPGLSGWVRRSQARISSSTAVPPVCRGAETPGRLDDRLKDTGVSRRPQWQVVKSCGCDCKQVAVESKLAWPSTTKISASASSTAAAAWRSMAAGRPAALMLRRATSCTRWRRAHRGTYHIIHMLFVSNMQNLVLHTAQRTRFL